MYLETVEDLAEQVADWCGVYGACKSDGETGCNYDKDNPLCCRVGFIGAIKERIAESVKNTELLKEKE